MKIKLLIPVFCLLVSQLFAQDYFQQEVNYKIGVILDDRAHTISGTIEIEYVNHAPTALDTIWMHVWGNAFSQPTTAFGEQKLRMGSTAFYFAPEASRGYYSGLNFTAGGEKLTWGFDKKHPDIAWIKLSQPLKTREKLVIHTPFTLKIPDSFSRLGHVGESYQMTQWYPKPAVYDRNGWHPIPYLDMGEFYSEFGNYDVTITLPGNYIVGATGVLQTDSERKFLAQKVLETQELIKTGFPEDTSFPSTSESMKTIRFTAENVHDFAWFADKRFHVLKEEAILGSGRKVDTWAFFTNQEAELWVKGAGYVKRAVEFYSKHIGEYPWPQATAVQSALSAGAGMEYPMITVIGKSGNAQALDDVITHEVGHNWFYGLLASNERDHAWMDEGINSYYEYRYMKNYYGDRVGDLLPGFMQKTTDMDLYELGYLFQARRNLDQAPETTSADFSFVNYGLSAYVKPGTAFGHLEAYLGTDVFDRIMQTYFEKWKFKHPYPEDLRELFETETGQDLAWFFDGYIFSDKKLDYSLVDISSAKETGEALASPGFIILVKNKGEIAAPYPVTGFRHGEQVVTKWFEGFWGEQHILFSGCDCDEFILDADHVSIEIFRRNNNIKTAGLFKTIEPVRPRFFGVLENSRQTTFNFLPIAGWNKYDGLMAGLLLHNGTVPARKLEYQVAPLYGFGSGDVAGLGSMKYNIFPASDQIRKISIGVSARQFNYRTPDSLRTETGFVDTHLGYRRLVPFFRIELMKSPGSKFYQILQGRSILLQEQFAVFETDSAAVFYTGNEWKGRMIHEVSWEIGDTRVLNPYSFRAVLERQQYKDVFGQSQKYLRAALILKAEHTYDEGRSVNFRLYAGKFFQKAEKTNRGFIFEEAFSLTAQGFNDYRYDELYFGRSETSGFLSRQIYEREGGMKIPLGSPYSEGRSNSMIIAVNLKADLPQDLPGKLPLKPYFDLGYYDDRRPISSGLSFSDQVWWQGGVAVELVEGMIGIYVPVLNSKNVKALYNQSGREGFFERIAFTINFNRLNPWDMLDRMEF